MSSGEEIFWAVCSDKVSQICLVDDVESSNDKCPSLLTATEDTVLRAVRADTIGDQVAQVNKSNGLDLDQNYYKGFHSVLMYLLLLLFGITYFGF